jgi:ABC-type uncharacterized transport system permease subunit
MNSWSTELLLFTGSTLRLSAPLLIAAHGELISERAGVLNMSIEGMMLLSAFAAVAATAATHSPAIGVICGIAAVLPVALLQAFLSVKARANQIVSGIGINLVCLGATTLLYRRYLSAGTSLQVEGFEKIDLAGVLGLPTAASALLNQTSLVYFALCVPLLAHLLLTRTTPGLALRASGQDPDAARKTGVNVGRTRVMGVCIAGVLAALAGALLSIGELHTFTENMTSGAGYLAIAAVIFGGWKTGRTFAACLIFGGATALQFQLPALGVELPIALLMLLPYVLALATIAVRFNREAVPAALAQPLANNA